MSNPKSKTLTMSEYYQLVSKSKSGWRCFFIMRERYDDIRNYCNHLQSSCVNLREQLRNGDDNVDIDFLKSQFIEMYDKLKEYTECPVCYEDMTGENMEVPKCGHIICKSCCEKIKATPTPNCPTCRKKY
jgi:hypothetical protein